MPRGGEEGTKKKREKDATSRMEMGEADSGEIFEG